jgi:hypothetical protein
MPIAEASVPTDRSSRYLVQLCRHADQMRRMRHGGGPRVDHVEYSETVGVIRFTDGVVTLQASTDTLTLRIEAADEDGVRRLQDGIANRLRTIGRRDGLTLFWHQAEGAADPAVITVDESSTERAPRKGRWRSRFGVLALLIAGSLIVALHLGVGGAALAASAWTGWVGNVLLAAILGTVVFIAAHVVLGRYAYRGGKAVHSRCRKRRTNQEFS